MSLDHVEKIASVLLYEGYLLYPYRPSAVKNRQRFNFGVLYPREYCEHQQGSDRWRMLTECLVVGNSLSAIDVRVRFLQLTDRDGWQEGREREVLAETGPLRLLTSHPLPRAFVFASAPASDGSPQAPPLEGELQVAAIRLRDEVYRISVSIANRVEPRNAAELSRDDALLQSLVSVHSILRVTNGEFVSLLDPPEEFRAEAADCRNEGAWPVLAGDEGQRGTMLASPIILYDYPQIAPESPGDLFDSTEIDEILALRILTMTDEEKREARDSDERARQILDRTETLPPEHFQKLHGALRGMRDASRRPR
jgi:hypothetical protein